MSFYCRIAIDYGGKRVLLDDDGWLAAKSLLLCRTTIGTGTELVFMFATKARGGGRSRGQRLRELFRKEARATCLIEPLL